jgi:dynein heavy chain
VPTNIEDNQDGTYTVTYTADQTGEFQIYVDFLDDQERMVPLRGVYKANFVDDAKPEDNMMTGGVMDRYIKKEMDRLVTSLSDTKKEVNPKDKELKNVKVLLRVKENVESTQKNVDNITLQIDQLEEALKLFHGKKLAKDAQIKSMNKLKKEWVDVKKITKEAKKEIDPYVAHEADRNVGLIKKLEEDISQFTGDMRKREFFQYACGTEQAKIKLDGVFGELKEFEDSIKDYGDNSVKFGKPELINKAVKDVDNIKVLITNMKGLWDHIAKCQETFDGFLSTKWVESNPGDMDEKTKKLLKQLKEMKVDKRANAYIGIMDGIKKWIIFLPLIEDLRTDAMRDRHWESLKNKIGVQFEINDKLLLSFIYDLDLGKYQEDVEETADQAK